MQPCNVNCMMLELLHTVLGSSMCPAALNKPRFCLDCNFGHALWVFHVLSPRRADMILRHQGDVLCCKQKLQCFAAQVVIGTIQR